MIAWQNNGVFSGKRQRRMADAATDTQYAVHTYRNQLKQPTTFMGVSRTRHEQRDLIEKWTPLHRLNYLDGWSLQIVHGQAYCTLACALPVAKNRFQPQDPRDGVLKTFPWWEASEAICKVRLTDRDSWLVVAGIRRVDPATFADSQAMFL